MPGVAKRAGMAGAFGGLDYRAALDLAPRGVDRDAFKALILRAETGMMAGFAKLREEDGG